MDLTSGHGMVPDGQGASRTAEVWADACTSLGVPPESHSDGSAVAAAIAGATPAYSATAAAALRQVAASLDHDLAAVALAPVVARVLAELPGRALERVLATLEIPVRADFIRAVVRTLPPPAVLAVATAGAASFGAPVSAPLARLLGKLRHETETLQGEMRARADSSFRSLIQRLVDGWTSSYINPGAGSFESLFTEKQEVRRTRLTPEPLRVIQLALEADAFGSAVSAAIAEQARDEAGLREVFAAIRAAPPRQATIMVSDQVATPARLAALLREEPVDFEIVDILVPRLGTTAARPMLDALVDAKVRSTRRALMDRLVRFGPDLAPLVTERLEDSRWFVLRNMIALLREAKCDVRPIALDRFSGHEDSRVRRETLQLQLEVDTLRERAIARGLNDPDRHVLRTALQAARTSLPESAVPALAGRVTAPDFPPEFRVMSLYLLGRSSSTAALDALLAFAQGGSSLFGKPRLAPKTPEMLAALGGLARSWRSERRAVVLLDLARRSKDEQILNALQASHA